MIRRYGIETLCGGCGQKGGGWSLVQCDHGLVAYADDCELFLADANEQIVQLQSTIRTQIEINDAQAKEIAKLQAENERLSHNCDAADEENRSLRAHHHDAELAFAKFGELQARIADMEGLCAEADTLLTKNWPADSPVRQKLWRASNSEALNPQKE